MKSGSGKLYKVIVADPPWPNTPSGFKISGSKVEFDGWWGSGRRMNIESICNMNIPSSPDSLLFLWTPAGELPHAIRVMKEWGFTYKTNLCWIKTNKDNSIPENGFGIGMWLGMQHELLLVGIKGDPKRPNGRTIMGSVMTHPRGMVTKGGGKPDLLQERIEQSGLEGPRLEMFARRKRRGWDVFGDIEGSIKIGDRA